MFVKSKFIWNRLREMTMKKVILSSLLALVSGATVVHAVDLQTTESLVACQNYVWEIEEYSHLPNAAISVFLLMTDENTITSVWHIMWDDPTVRAAGNCIVIDGTVDGFEDYTN
jgi:hypothetical protein